jgi:hypothetical protein
LWPDIQAREYGIDDFVCRKRIKRVIDEAIVSRKRRRNDDHGDDHTVKKVKTVDN